MIKPFRDSIFVVTFSGECPESRIIRGWENVLKHIDRETGGDGDTNLPFYEQFDDEDNWGTLGHAYPNADDERHTYSSEIDEGVRLQITRITEYED